MGTYCSCTEEQDKGEVKTSLVEVQHPSQKISADQHPKKDINDLSAAELVKVQRLQALVRAWNCRRKYNIRKSALQSDQLYFKEDCKETASTDTKMATKVEQRQYTFKSTGAVYSGQWLGGIRNGQGKITWKDGATYEGTWDKNTAQGAGKLTYPNGDVYEGNFVNNKASGQGKLTTKDSVYQGEWKANKQNGKGKETFTNGSTFEGIFVDGQKTGAGRYTWADGSNYRGMLANSQLQGVGEYKWTDGRQYLGEWQNGQMNGYGRFKSDGKGIYTGQFRDGLKHGFGIYDWLDKSQQYAGYWNNGKQHGLAVFTDKVGTKKYGLWCNSTRICYYEPVKVAAIDAGTHDWTQDLPVADRQEAASLRKEQTFKEPAGNTGKIKLLNETLLKQCP